MDDFALYSALLFDDDTLAIQLLHRGTRESCEKTANMINALSYNGPKKVVESQVRWMPWDEFQRGAEECADDHDDACSCQRYIDRQQDQQYNNPPQDEGDTNDASR